VYNEVLSSPGRIALDWVKIEISQDGITWYTVFYWGDSIPDTNSNVDISNPLFGGTEVDNRSILTTSLYNTTGITIDVDPFAPAGSYPWMRISSPAGSANGPDIDAIQPYYP
jgi:hypothetical protein